ncbi:hypothetical protein CF326_g667 [Tilletia indica]|nr:hypothetical protein CF326_g667 [Tilletia indica]
MEDTSASASTSASVTADSQRPPLQSHLFPSFSALNIHGDADKNNKNSSRLKRTKARAHKLRNKLHEWEDKSPLGLPRAMPDMRFEQSYLATIRGFMHELQPEEGEEEKRAVREDRHGTDDHDAEGEKTEGGREKEHRVVATVSRTSEPELWLGNLKVEWYPLLWVTFRDQIISPLVQGTVWGLAGLALAQTRSFMMERRRLSAQHAPSHRSSASKGSSSSVGKSLLQALGLGRR